MSFGLDGLDNLSIKIATLSMKMRCPGVLDIEEAERVEIGKTYFVNVATTRKDSPGLGASLPVLGDEHDDSDFIPIFPDNVPHYHIDWRFIPHDLYPSVVKLFVEVFGQNGGPQNYGYAPDTRNLQLACVIPGSVIVRVERWPLPCFRQQLRWEAVPGFLINLEAAYKDKKVECNRCPHRGISLTGAPADERGVRVCPGHGLAWDREGCLVSRTGDKGK